MVRFIPIQKLSSTHKPTKDSSATCRCEKHHEKCSLDAKILTFNEIPLSHTSGREDLDVGWACGQSRNPDLPNTDRGHTDLKGMLVQV